MINLQVSFLDRKETTMQILLLLILLLGLALLPGALGAPPKTILNQYNNYMSTWVKRQIAAIDKQIPPKTWHTALNSAVLPPTMQNDIDGDGDKDEQPMDQKTLMHLRSLHNTRNRLHLVDALYDTKAHSTLKSQLNQMLVPGASTIMGMEGQLPECCTNPSFNPNVRQKPGCSADICNAYHQQFSERLMSDLAAAETYIADQQVLQKSSLASKLLSDRVFDQHVMHGDASIKPVLPGVFEIGQGFYLPKGLVDARYFEVNTLNIERNIASSELSSTWSIPGAVNVVPIHQYHEPRVDIFTNMRQYSKIQQNRLHLIGGRGVLLHGDEADHLRDTFARAQVLVEIRLFATSYRITMADSIFVNSEVGTREQLRSSHRREAVGASALLVDGENLLNQGMNKDKTVLSNSLGEKSVRASFCPNSGSKSDFPAAVQLPDCTITERSLSFFKHFPSVLGRLNGMHRSFIDELKQRQKTDMTRECGDTDLQLYMMFLTEFGSHYVSGVDMGCSVTWTHTVRRSEVRDILATVNSMGE
jgi:hypothetical protein